MADETDEVLYDRSMGGAHLYLCGCFESLEIAEDALARFGNRRSQKDIRIAVVFGRELEFPRLVRHG